MTFSVSNQIPIKVLCQRLVRQYDWVLDEVDSDVREALSANIPKRIIPSNMITLSFLFIYWIISFQKRGSVKLLRRYN